MQVCGIKGEIINLYKYINTYATKVIGKNSTYNNLVIN